MHAPQFNPHPGTEFRRTPDDRLLAFRSVVVRGGRVCTIRDSRGDDELAACGQLGDVSKARRPRPQQGPAAGGGGGGGGEGGGNAGEGAGRGVTAAATAPGV
jgi:hypothetical protein